MVIAQIRAQHAAVQPQQRLLVGAVEIHAGKGLRVGLNVRRQLAVVGLPAVLALHEVGAPLQAIHRHLQQLRAPQQHGAQPRGIAAKHLLQPGQRALRRPSLAAQQARVLPHQLPRQLRRQRRLQCIQVGLQRLRLAPPQGALFVGKSLHLILCHAQRLNKPGEQLGARLALAACAAGAAGAAGTAGCRHHCTARLTPNALLLQRSAGHRACEQAGEEGSLRSERLSWLLPPPCSNLSRTSNQPGTRQGSWGATRGP